MVFLSFLTSGFHKVRGARWKGSWQLFKQAQRRSSLLHGTDSLAACLHARPLHTLESRCSLEHQRGEQMSIFDLSSCTYQAAGAGFVRLIVG